MTKRTKRTKRTKGTERTQQAGFIPKHGGYRRLWSYQKSEIVYDATVFFCNRFLTKRDRTYDQMVQAARSGKQNIAEGSQASGTSKEFEIKLTSVARASLEELLIDYQDFLRVRGIDEWPPGHRYALRLKQLNQTKNATLCHVSTRHRASQSSDLWQRYYRFGPCDQLSVGPEDPTVGAGFCSAGRIAREDDTGSIGGAEKGQK